MDLRKLVRQLLGSRYILVDFEGAKAVLMPLVKRLTPRYQRLFEQAYLSRDGRRRLKDSEYFHLSVLRALLKGLMGEDERKALKACCRDVADWTFGSSVYASELSEALFGDPHHHRLYALLGKVRKGELDLPLPQRDGRLLIWTREAAEKWRAFVLEESDELDPEAGDTASP